MMNTTSMSIGAPWCMNGQVERTNDMVLQGLKPRIFNRLNKFGGRWVVELLTVLWSLRMTPSWATSYTPFFMSMVSRLSS